MDASDLFQRGAEQVVHNAEQVVHNAEQVVHNAELYESRRSSAQEDRIENLNGAGSSNHPEVEEQPPYSRVVNEPARSVTRPSPRGRQSRRKNNEGKLNRHLVLCWTFFAILFERVRV